MRLLADENFPRKAVDRLRRLGHDVAWVKETAPAIRDEEVLEWAKRDRRVVLTQDKGFGEHAFRSGLPAESGVILFRVLPVPDLVTEIAEKLFQPGASFEGRFVVVDQTRVRERALP